jgi:hypothetical protein
MALLGRLHERCDAIEIADLGISLPEDLVTGMQIGTRDEFRRACVVVPVVGADHELEHLAPPIDERVLVKRIIASEGGQYS